MAPVTMAVSSSGSTPRLEVLLDDMRSTDSDVRYMALNDLLMVVRQHTSELRGSRQEQEAVERVLELLQDTHSEVKNLAVTALGVFATRLRDDHVQRMMEVVCAGMSSSQEEERDICASALRTLLHDLSQAGDKAARWKEMIVRYVTPLLASQLEVPDYGLQATALSALHDVLLQAGPLVAAQAPLEQVVAETLLSKLAADHSSLVRRAMQGLGALCQLCSAHTYNAVLERGLAGQPLSAHTSVQLLGVLARETPQRLSPHVPTYVHRVLSVLRQALGTDDDVGETCLATLQGLVCVGSMDASCVSAATEAALAALTYDPNAMDMDEDEDINMDDDELELDDVSDDDDMSWRIRRAACRVLGTLYEHGCMDASHAPRIAASLADRLIEREETVRLEALAALMHVLRVAPRALGPHTQMVHALSSWRSATAQVAALQALTTLVASLGADLPQSDVALHTALSVTEDDAAASHYSKGRCMAGLELLKQMCLSAPTVVLADVDRVSNTLAQVSCQPHHRTALEALAVCPPFFVHVAPQAPAACAERLCEVLCRPRDHAAALDASLVALDAALCAVGPRLASLPRLLQVIATRLQDPVTRVRCVQMVRDVMTCRSLQTCMPVHELGRESLPLLASFAHHRDMGAAALHALHSVAVVLPSDAQPTVLELLQRPMPPLDTPALPPTLALAQQAVQYHPPVAHHVAELVLPAMLPALADVPPPALEAFFALLTSLASAEDALAPRLVEALEHAWEAHCAQRSVHMPLVFAQCLVAAATASASIDLVLSRVEALMNMPDVVPQTLAHYTIGVLGQRSLLAGWPHAKTVYERIGSMHSQGTGGTFALGGMLLGDQQFLTPVAERLAEDEPAVLPILREAFGMASETQTRELAPSVWPYLIRPKLLSAEPDACTECIARIVYADTSLLSELAQLVDSQHEQHRAMALGALRTLLSLDRQQALDIQLHFSAFMQRLSDPCLSVRHASVLALHAALNSRAALVMQHADLVLPLLYETTVVREELKRSVRMGPFTVIQDDGLDLRKNAHETLFTLVDTCLDQVRTRDVLDCVLRALSDDDSIKLLGCLMILRLADLECADVAAYLDAIAPKLHAVLTRKLRDNATKQEVEKASEITHASLRVLARLSPMASSNAAWSDLLTQTRASPQGPAFLALLAEQEDLT